MPQPSLESAMNNAQQPNPHGAHVPEPVLPPILQRYAQRPTQGDVSPRSGMPFRRRRTDPSGEAMQRGVTLIELVFTAAIVATLCAISLPALGSLVQGSRSRAANNTLITALNLARSSAVTRGSEIVLCPSADQKHCDDSIWWQQGWIVFQDLDRNGTRSVDEPILHIVEPQPGMAIASSIGRDHVTYRIDGSATGTNLTFTLCDRRGSAHASTIVVSNSGRPRQGTATKAQAAAACAGL